MSANHDGYIRPWIKWSMVVALVLLVVAVATPRKHENKQISPVETTQATQAVVAPAEETSNQVETGVVIRTRIQFGVGSTNSQTN